jgi:hypothetical protein
MKHTVAKTLTLAVLVTPLGAGSSAGAETVNTRIGKLMFDLGVSTKETVAKAYDEIDFQRAAQAYLGACRDKNSDAFDGGKRYRLRIPANVPVKQFRLVTLYK